MPLRTRRQFLTAIALSSVAACTNTANVTSNLDESLSTEIDNNALLASIAFDILPHPTLSPDLYLRVAETLLNQTNPAAKEVVTEGLTMVMQLAPNTNGWLELNEDDRIAFLATIETSAFFALVKNTTINVIYGDPELWQLVGYGGSSVEYGGYLNRGFDDINWLTE